MASRTALVVLAVAVTLLAGACSSSSKTASPTSSRPAPTDAPGSTRAGPSTTDGARGSGPVDVLYAGSLVNVMEKQIGPAFKAATGYTFQGFSAGSTALAAQIKGKVHQGDVFISASPTVNDTLMGSSNGNWASWYVTFADSPLVIGYNPHSRFAHDLKTTPWYGVIAEPGFQIGRTDPVTDPKGKLTATALAEAAAAYHAPALHRIAASSSNVYPEETLVGRLEAGQLDAAFFYTSETAAAGIPTVKLAGVALKATYTVTVLNRARHRAGGEAFVAYLLGPDAAAILTRSGFRLVQPPKVTGSGVPSRLSSAASG